MRAFGFASIVALSISAPAHGQQDSRAACAALDGARVVADDGTYLGTIGPPLSTDSIFNQYGKGSKYASESVWNKYGTYGSKYSSQSVMNEYTSTPPMIIKNQQVIGFLTRNKNVNGAFDPILVAVVCYDVVMD